ncbi:hypothetical protein HHI36_002906 [Cryptolaemus montrouzieri]|uniref:Zinc transporter foi n=1 Tax=Cryptolaemus montrouzieri TaxID=559131 RepID=A0ABD2PCE3_9CUCU
MAHPILSVCIFCLICATHSPCSSHAAVKHESVRIRHENSSTAYSNPPSTKNMEIISRVKLKSDFESSAESTKKLKKKDCEECQDKIEIQSGEHNLLKRRSINTNKSEDSLLKKSYSKKIFEKFGDGTTMNMEEFQKFIERLDLLQVLSNKMDGIRNLEDSHEKPSTQNDKSCIDGKHIFSDFNDQNTSRADAKINDTMLQIACPAILYSLMVGKCNEDPNVHSDENNHEIYVGISVWIYSTSAVILTSACGVLALVIIPVMQKKIYKPLLQFLVALAVGTLAGDAFLHLLPHAMTRAHSHGLHGHHNEMLIEEESMNPHDENMWKGFVSMMGLTFFFLMEKLILVIAKWRKGKQKKAEIHSHMQFFPNGLDDLNDSNPTQCMDRYNPYPYCYQDILNHQIHGCPLESDKTASTMLGDVDTSDISSFKKSKSPTDEKLEDSQNVGRNYAENNLSSCTEANKMLPEKAAKNDSITIILREHGTNHHGHSHSHGHVHAAPQNFSSVAWMVIMGDGLHNFTDGMAIGAAFSSSLAGGFSTAVAVFCHELPHELGDFAMLLKAGMTIKQALFYNLLSSVLSLLGNIVGIYLGNTEYASSWVFAAAAGMFIYIALVDMIPELSSAHEDESNLTQCCLHVGGLTVGFGIMTLIAMYEQDLKSIFKEPVPMNSN